MSSCSMLSLDAQEPMIASTLEHIHHWVLIEQPKAWPARPKRGREVSEQHRAMIVRAPKKKNTYAGIEIHLRSQPNILYREQTVHYERTDKRSCTTQMTPYDSSNLVYPWFEIDTEFWEVLLCQGA